MSTVWWQPGVEWCPNSDLLMMPGSRSKETGFGQPFLEHRVAQTGGFCELEWTTERPSPDRSGMWQVIVSEGKRGTRSSARNLECDGVPTCLYMVLNTFWMGALSGKAVPGKTAKLTWRVIPTTNRLDGEGGAFNTSVQYLVIPWTYILIIQRVLKALNTSMVFGTKGCPRMVLDT